MEMSSNLTAIQLKIVEAAGPLFADLGYEIVSVREIASVADVHFSSINYHFGTKEHLYENVLRHAASCGDLDEFIRETSDNMDDPVGQLRELAWHMLLDYVDGPTDNWASRLLSREMMKPSKFSGILREIWDAPLRFVAARLAKPGEMESSPDRALFRACCFFILLDQLGQSRELMGHFMGHEIAPEWVLEEFMANFVPLDGR
jgi:TetR/AcrR family transcriptional regulator, regulator of cefoperazone and chloramphenicol sensitivity